jgi:hypothetical protein
VWVCTARIPFTGNNSIIDDNFTSYCIEKGPEFFQNDNCSFENSVRKVRIEKFNTYFIG